jgi:predicted site-specific integrase-resolvase
MFYRIKDIEKILDRDRNTILRWEREGKILPARKDSRGWRIYTDEDIQKIINYISNANPYYSSATIGLNKNIGFSKNSQS